MVMYETPQTYFNKISNDNGEMVIFYFVCSNKILYFNCLREIKISCYLIRLFECLFRQIENMLTFLI